MASSVIDVTPVFTNLLSTVNSEISANAAVLATIAGSLFGLGVLFSVYHRVKHA